VNRREKEVLEFYKEDGWKPLRGGWPDFLMLKTEDGDITDVKCVEVKSPSGELTYKQGLCRKVLEDFGLDYEVEVVE